MEGNSIPSSRASTTLYSPVKHDIALASVEPIGYNVNRAANLLQQKNLHRSKYNGYLIQSPFKKVIRTLPALTSNITTGKYETCLQPL
ncbi:hypothetical protein STEG23_033103 [Scotinomys teguina]